MLAPQAPSDDKRWRVVDARIRRLGRRPDALIEVLHTVQGLFGYLDEPSLAYVAASLGVPPSRAYGVATFYSYFVLRPPGEHSCVVCMGTACYLAGGRAILDTLRDRLGVGPGETTADGGVSVMVARCVGVCSMAPVVIFDGRAEAHATPASVSELVGAAR
jgi:bidirectional [NiFe] hydrogenase diaphorase subunit